jgi:hypothetical protein
MGAMKRSGGKIRAGKIAVTARLAAYKGGVRDPGVPKRTAAYPLGYYAEHLAG